MTFSTDLGGGIRPAIRPADRSGESEVIDKTGKLSVAGSWTPNGRTLVYHAVNTQQTAADIWKWAAGEDPVVFLSSEFSEMNPRLSPNGKWLAYMSGRTGEHRAYVQAFPDGGSVFSVSSGPGGEVVWSPTGQELFYRHGALLWAVDVETEPGFSMEVQGSCLKDCRT